MPLAFCWAQAIITSISSYILAGICACLAWGTYTSVLHPRYLNGNRRYILILPTQHLVRFTLVFIFVDFSHGEMYTLSLFSYIHWRQPESFSGLSSRQKQSTRQHRLTATFLRLCGGCFVMNDLLCANLI
jgi:hypothetical protein